jgi:hypothetical protein
MQQQFYIADSDAVADAHELLTHYGENARSEAAARASRSREVGNIIHFCRWRQIARLVEWMDSDAIDATLH